MRGSARLLPLLAAMLLALAGAALQAQPAREAAPPPGFRDADEERRFHALLSELRCVMCQNQSLADSNAQIALDLRREVFDMMRAGRSDREIKEFLVERYGEFVLYQPPVARHTWLLWFGPVLVLLAGATVVARIVRARSRPAAAAEAGGEEQEW